jgi:ABC-type amino acid transport substrate-binding protein
MNIYSFSFQYALFGFFVVQLSSDLTMQRLKSNINGTQDLKGRRVGVVEGTTGLDYRQNERGDIDVFERVIARSARLRIQPRGVVLAVR